MRLPLIHNCPFFLRLFSLKKYKKGNYYVLYNIDAITFTLILTYLSYGTVYYIIY